MTDVLTDPGEALSSPSEQQERWIGRYIGEALGDFLLIFFGCGIVFVAVLFGGVGDLFSAEEPSSIS